MGFNFIYWIPISGKYCFGGSLLEKLGKTLKKQSFPGQLQPDWGNTTRAATAWIAPGSKGLYITGSPTVAKG